MLQEEIIKKVQEEKKKLENAKLKQSQEEHKKRPSCIDEEQEQEKLSDLELKQLKMQRLHELNGKKEAEGKLQMEQEREIRQIKLELIRQQEEVEQRELSFEQKKEMKKEDFGPSKK